jgi:hypothetical protein
VASEVRFNRNLAVPMALPYSRRARDKSGGSHFTQSDCCALCLLLQKDND